MPLWGWIAMIAGVLAVLAGGLAAGIVAYRSAEERTVLKLIRWRESVDFVRQALGESLGRLAEGSQTELRDFAEKPDSAERRALHEVASRAKLLTEELDITPLPRSVVPAAQALADTAYLVEQEAGRIRDDLLGDAALEALGCVDLDAVETYYRAATTAVRQVCDACGVDDSAVYGGGLYL